MSFGGHEDKFVTPTLPNETFFDVNFVQPSGYGVTYLASTGDGSTRAYTPPFRPMWWR